MLIKLSELKNLIISDKNNPSSKERRNILNAIACILSEFAIAYLKVDINDDKIFPYIRNYFNAEVESYNLINKLLQEEEIRQRFSFIPILKNKEFNGNEWSEICEKISININDSDNINAKNNYLISDNKHIVEKTFFNIINKDGSFFAQKYLYDSEIKKYYFQTIGNEEELIENSNPFVFYSNINANKEEERINFTDDEFFKMDQMSELSEDQKSSIRASVDKNLLVLAGAGSGKTRSLVSRLAYLHLVLGIPLNKIILLTFTRNAAESMRHKAEELINEIYLRFDKKEEPHVYTKTIDAFFLKLILDYYPEFGFTDKPQVNVDDRFKNIRNNYMQDIIEKNHLYGILKSNVSLDEIYKQMIDNVSGIAVQRTGFNNLFNFYLEKQIENNSLLDFTSINYIVKNTINNNPLLKNIIIDRYACVLIDEFQDISHLQNEVLEILYNTKIHFTFVGDDDQSIYGWRGADVSIIKKIAKMSETNTKYLLINYRNNPNIVNAGNDILKQIEDRAKNKEIIPNKITGEKIRFSINDYRYTNIADEVKRLHNNGHQYKEFSILTRTNKQIEDIANSLRAINVPIIIRNVPIKLDNYYYLLKALICIKSEFDPYNQTNIIIEKAKLNEVTNNVVNEAICNNGKCSGNLQIIQYIAKQMFSGEEKELYKIIEKFSSAAAVEFKKIINGNLDNETIEAIIEYSRDCEIPWPVSHKQLNSFFIAFEKKKNQKINVNNKKNAVTISTIHGAKGLEYNIVMMIGLNDGEYPDVSKIEDKYQKSLKDLEQIKNARTEYNTIKSLNNENTINDLIQETQSLIDCEGTKKAAKSLEIYIKENKNGLKFLKIEEIEEYIDLFKKEILPKEEEFKRQVSINNKEILECNDKLDRLKARLELYKHRNELAKETNKNDKKDFDLNNIIEKINECNEQTEKQEARRKEKALQLELLQNEYKIFKNKIIKLHQFYNTAILAQGYLIDMQREYEIESLKNKLEEERKNQINEEKRTFYVAVTRAKDYLYLFTDENKRQSEFLDLINNKYKVDYKVMTKNEQDEFERLSNSLKEEFKKPEQYIDIDSVSTKTNEIISSDLFKKGITEKYKNFLIENPWCSDLPAEVSEFFKQGICLQFVSELTGKTFYAEVAHNFKKVAETILEITAGVDAKPYIVSNKESAQNVIGTIRDVARNFGCSVPSRQFIEGLITESPNQGHHIDRLESLKNASIQHYIIRSQKFYIDDYIIKSWKNNTFYGDPNKFLKAALTLANIRNTLEHEKNEERWPDDPITIMLNSLKEIFMTSYKNIDKIINTDLSQKKINCWIDDTYYVNEEGIKQKSCWIDDTYYVNEEGIKQRNCWIHDTYYVNEEGIKQRNCWIDKEHYVNELGMLIHGKKKFKRPATIKYSDEIKN